MQTDSINCRNGTDSDRNPAKKDRDRGLSVFTGASIARKSAKNAVKRLSVLCIFEFEILYADGISLLESELLKQLYAALPDNVIIEISHGTAVVEIR